MINPHISSLHKSATLKITALTKKLIREGRDVVNLAAGEPDFDTPCAIKEEGKRAIDEGFTKYTPSAGIPALKEAIAKKLREENNIPVEGKNIIVTAGAKYAVFAALFTLIGDGNEVIIPSPYWVSYPEMVKLIGGRVKILPTSPEDNFKINIDNLKKVVTPASKLLILNYPNNPTGITYSHQDLKEIFSFVKEKEIFVLSDEIYEKLVYDGREHISFASLPEAANLALTVNGFSKAFSMTGWRIGYLAGEDEIINQASKIIDHTTSCANAISQKAALAALDDKQWAGKIRKEFENRRNVLWEGLSECRGLEPLKPQGTFYLFCKINKKGCSSFEFASQLLEKYLVSCIPADPFGVEGYLRFSFATSIEQINKGIERIKTFLNDI